MEMALSVLYLHRRKLAFAVTCSAALLSAAVPWRMLQAAQVEAEKPQVVELAPAEEPPKPTPEPPPPEPPKAQPVQPREVQPKPVSPATVSRVESVVPAATEAAHADVTEPPPAPKPVPARVEPAVQAPPLAEPPPAPVAVANTSASFADKIRQLINAAKAYPTGREAMTQRPEGTVEVCVTLARNGEYVDANVKESSGSILLDQAGKRLVARLRYPAFDESAFRGQAQHEFCIRLKYEVPKN